MGKPIGDYKEIDCLRALVAKAYGVGANGEIGGNGGSVTGIQETRTLTKQASEEASYTIPAGSVGYTIKLSVDFVGTHLGDDVTGEENATIADNPQPGNTLPEIPITRTAGKFSVIENRRP